MKKLLIKLSILITLLFPLVGIGQEQKEAQDLLEIAINSLQQNIWFDTVSMDARITLNNKLKASVQYQPGGSYPVFDDYGMQSTFKKTGDFRFSSQKYLGNNTDPVTNTFTHNPDATYFEGGRFSYDVYDTEKNVKYDGGKEINFTKEFSVRHRIFDFLTLKHLENNHMMDNFPDSLKEYAKSVESGAYVLSMDVQDDSWIAKFTLTENPEIYAEVVFSPEKNFNVTKYIYNNPFRTVGYHETNFEYVEKDGEWILDSLLFEGDNENMTRNYSVKFASFLVGEAANLSEADFDWRQLPIQNNAVIKDYRNPDTIQYDYKTGLPDESIAGLDELLSTDVSPGTLARVDKDTQEVLKVDSPDAVLPQLASIRTDIKGQSSHWSMYVLMFLGIVIVIVLVRVAKKRFLALFLGGLLLCSMSAEARELETVEELIAKGEITNVNGLCGINCVSLILADQNEVVDLGELKDLLNWKGTGTSMKEMLVYFQNKQWETKAIEITFDSLLNILMKNDDAYAIVHLGSGERHWVVVKSDSAHTYEVIDYPFRLAFDVKDLGKWEDGMVKVLLVSPTDIKEPSILSRDIIIVISLATLTAFFIPLEKKAK